MPQFVGTLIFQNDTYEYGWSSSWYFTKDGHSDVLPDLLAIGDKYLPILTEKTRLRGLRISQLGIRGDVLVREYGTAKPGTATGTESDPCTALLVALYTADNLYQGRRFVHGIPVTMFAGREMKDPNPFASALDDLATVIRSKGGFKAKKKDSPNLGTLVIVPINDVVYKGMTCHKVGPVFNPWRGRRRSC